MSIGISPLLLIVGLALLGVIPAVIAYRKDRGFVSWWIYGTALFPVALAHALLLPGEWGRRVPEDDVICPSCGEPLPRFAVGCRQCGWVLMESFASQPGTGPRAERAEAATVRDTGPQRDAARQRETGAERAEAETVRDNGAQRDTARPRETGAGVRAERAEAAFVRDSGARHDSARQRDTGGGAPLWNDNGARRDSAGQRGTGAGPPPWNDNGAQSDSPRRRDTGAGPPPWSDEAFARVSRMGPGPEEPPDRKPDRRLLGGVVVFAALAGVTAVALAVLPVASWFGEDPPSRRSGFADAGTMPPLPEPLPEQPPQMVSVPPTFPEPVMPVEPVPETAPSPAVPPLPPLPPESRSGPSSAVKSAPVRSKTDGGGAEEKAATASPAPAPPPRAVTKTPDPPRPAPQPAPSASRTDDGGQADVAAVGDLVVWLQRRLTALGYFEGPVNGRADARTRAAIREWQRSRDMTVTGRIDSALIVSLRRAKVETRAAEDDRR